MVPRSRASLALLALVVGSSLAVAAAARRPAELSNSFIITSLQDLQPASIRGLTLTPCEYAVARARSLQQKHFSVVVTAYWQGGMGGVRNYAFKDVSPAHANGVAFPQPTVDNIAAWKSGLQRCFRAAAKADFKAIQVLLHIDSDDHSTWRNLLDFDPLAKYAGYSYEDVVVRPTAEALRTTLKPSQKVWFMMSGEMGRSIWAHPISYLKLMSKYRGSLAEHKRPGTVKMGVALHWNKVCGNCFDMPEVKTHAEYNTTYSATFRQRRAELTSKFNVPMIKAVFDVSDALGLSHYAPSPQRGVSAGDFGLPIDTAAFELSHWGIDLKRMIADPKKDFLFSEVGIGGGDNANQRAAGSLTELANNIHNGIWAVYNVAQDPWRNADYKEYRRAWFTALMQFLQAGGAPRYKVDAAFIWSVGTWDVAAIHPISTSAEGTYADWEVVKMMRWLSSKAVA